MRIAMVLDSLMRGGAERQALNATLELTRAGHDVELIHYHEAPDGYDHPALQQARVTYLPKGNAKLAFVWRLRGYLKRRDFEVVHGFDRVSCIHSTLAGRLAGVPVVLAGCRVEYRERGLVRLANRVVRYLATGWVVNSRAIVDSLARGLGVQPHECHVVYNGIYPGTFVSRLTQAEAKLRLGIEPDHGVVSIIARLVPQKNHRLFLDMAARILADRPATRFLIIGEGGLQPFLKTHASTLGILDAVLFLGNRPDVPDLLAATDVTVLTSDFEGLANTLVESMCVGIPVVTTSYAGVGELLTDGVEGLISPLGDSEAFANKVCRLLGDGCLRLRMGEAGRHSVLRRFSMHAMAKSLLDVYQDCLTRARAASNQPPPRRRSDEDTMKIAYLASVFPSHTQTFIFNEVEDHCRSGLDLLALSCDVPSRNRPLSEATQPWLDRTVAPPGIGARLAATANELIRHPVAMTRNLFWLIRLLFIDPVEFLKGVREYTTAAYMAASCRAHGTQHIHIHFASRSLSTGIMLGRLVGVPISCTVHAFDLWTRSGRNLRYRLKRCSFIAAISNHNVDYLRKECGAFVADLCHVVHCGIDPTSFDTSRRDPVPGKIVLISGFAPKKGHCYLLDACAILKKRGVSHECVLVGTGTEQEQIEQQIRRLGIEDTVVLAGPVANDKLQPYLDSAAIFALPAVVTDDGDKDGIPVALMEAMASGVPVISTTVSGIPELLRDGKAGALVPQRNANALANALEALLTDKEKALSLAAAGRAVIEEEFDIRKTSQQLRDLFAKTIGAKGNA